MAQNGRSAQDFNPKHRILGAVILVAAAVIVVPLVLKQEKPPADLGSAPSATPDERSEAPNKVIVSPVTRPTATKERATERPAPVAEPAPILPPVSDVPPKPASPPPAAEAPAPSPAPAKTAAPATAMPDKGWAVQVGTFTNQDNANRLSSKLTQHGHEVLTERISLEGRAAVRLRVGPFADKSAALKAQARIERELHLKGVVLALP